MKATGSGMAASRPGLWAGGLAGALVALVVLCYIALWAVTAFQLRGGVLDWIEARQAEGYRVTHGSLGIGGFPRLARVTVGAPVIAAPDGRALSWSWAGGQAMVEANPLHPDALTVRLSGEDAVSINVDGKLRTYRGTAEELSLRAHGSSDAPSLSLSVRSLAMAAEEPGDIVDIGRLMASAEVLEHQGAKPARAYRVEIHGADIQLPRQFDLPLGQAFAAVDAEAVVRGMVSPRGDLPDALARWRDMGGAVELGRVRLSYGPLDLQGSGTASLDEGMQPVGTFMARIRGFQPTLAALAGRGLIDEQIAAKARIALAILSRPGDDGIPVLSVPLSLHERRLSVGPLPLMVVPPVEWPRGPSPRTGELPPMAGAATG